jgi:hypothetical protein
MCQINEPRRRDAEKVHQVRLGRLPGPNPVDVLLRDRGRVRSQNR